MPTLIFGHDEALADWAARQIPHVGEAGFGPCSAIGIAGGLGAEDELYGVCVFHDYQQQFATIQVSMAARSPRWCSKGVLRALLHYPFVQLGVQKLWVAIPHRNQPALDFNARLGMTRESVLRHHFGRNRHAVIMSMLDTEYQASRWNVDQPVVREEAA